MIKEWLLKNAKSVKIHLKLMKRGLKEVGEYFVKENVTVNGGLNISGVKIILNINLLFQLFVLFVQKSLTHIIKKVDFVLQVVEVKLTVERIIINIVESQLTTVCIGGYGIIMEKLKNVKTTIVKKKAQFLNGHYYMGKRMKEKKTIFGNYVRVVICSMIENLLLFLRLKFKYI